MTADCKDLQALLSYVRFGAKSTFGVAGRATVDHVLRSRGRTGAREMDDDRFWAFIGAARDAAGDDVEDRVSGLEQVLLNHHPDEVAEFRQKYDEMLARAYRW